MSTLLRIEHLAAGVLVNAVVLVGCSGGHVPAVGESKPKPMVAAGHVLLQGAGATFPAALYEEWFRQYGKRNPKYTISYDAVGSGEGVRRFVGRQVEAAERVDFGASDAAMRDDEIAMVADGAVLLPVAGGSVALAYNLPDVPELKLSRDAYVGMFSGRITTWNDSRIARTNRGIKLPPLTIATVVRQDGSGTTFAFTRHLDAISEAWRARGVPSTLVNWPGNAMRAAGNDGVAGRIKQSIGSIGYVGYESARRTGLRVALLENRAGNFVAPSERTTTLGLSDLNLGEAMRAYVPDPAGAEAYPIVTLTWVLLYQRHPEPQKADALYDLFKWCLTDGQQLAGPLGYAPLPPSVQRVSLDALDAIRLSHAP